MTHVVDFEKTALSTPFRGVLPPFGQQISAESGTATQFLAPGKPGWPTTSTWPLFSRLTPHAAARRDQRGQVVRRPPPLANACHRLPDAKDRTGPDLDERSLYFSMSPNQAIPAYKSIRFSSLAAVGP